MSRQDADQIVNRLASRELGMTPCGEIPAAHAKIMQPFMQAIVDHCDVHAEHAFVAALTPIMSSRYELAKSLGACIELLVHHVQRLRTVDPIRDAQEVAVLDEAIAVLRKQIEESKP